MYEKPDRGRWSPVRSPTSCRQQAVSSDDRYYADRVLGCLLGGAVGDALGFAVEFRSLSDIQQRFGPAGIQQPVLNDAGKTVVSDDTQMTLFTAEGLIASFAKKGSIIQSDALDAVCAATLDWYAMQTGGEARGQLAEYARPARRTGTGYYMHGRLFGWRDRHA